jgi:hypothetical protein
MNYAKALLFALVGTSAIAVGCGGGVSSSGLNPDASASSGSSGGSNSSGSSSSGTGGSSGSSSGTAGGSSGSGDGGNTPTIIPRGATPGMGMVLCGGATCNPPDICCSGVGGGGGGGGSMCTTLATCAMGGPTGGDVYTCTGKANCTAPQICCVTPGRGRAPDVSACQATCGMNQDHICQTDAECAMGQTCRASAPGVMACQPPVIPPGGGTQGTGAITCGATTCTAPNVCCSGGGGGGGGGGLACNTLNACDANNDVYTCTGQANCAAPNVCCVTLNGSGGGNDLAVCQPTCAGANSSQVCQTNAECTGGMTCRTGAGNGIPGAITTCRPPPMAAPDAGSAPPDAGTGPTGMDAAVDHAAPPEAGTGAIGDASGG